jgi:hypothetical protein
MRLSRFPIAALLVLSACGGGTPLPASAAQLRPNVFAPIFCAARQAGIAEDEAIAIAVKASIDFSLPSIPGDPDVDVAVGTALSLCPKQFASPSRPIV